jgi:Rieske Fe-S protein
MATGFAKWGMANGTIAGSVIADLAMGRASPFSEVFDSKRLALKQGAPDLLKANARVVKSLVTERVLGGDVPDVEELAPGSGGVVRVSGERAAAYRDPDGLVHAVSPVCTHLGCQVEFNNAEQSWDCPCHGSRFDLDGEVLHGPAVEDLAPIETHPSVGAGSRGG